MLDLETTISTPIQLTEWRGYMTGLVSVAGKCISYLLYVTHYTDGNYERCLPESNTIVGLFIIGNCNGLDVDVRMGVCIPFGYRNFQVI